MNHREIDPVTTLVSSQEYSWILAELQCHPGRLILFSLQCIEALKFCIRSFDYACANKNWRKQAAADCSAQHFVLELHYYHLRTHLYTITLQSNAWSRMEGANLKAHSSLPSAAELHVLISSGTGVTKQWQTGNGVMFGYGYSSRAGRSIQEQRNKQASKSIIP